ANLSISGLFAITDLPLTAGQHVEITLHLPDRDPFRVTGLVSWTNDPAAPRAPDLPQGLGIRITRIALPDKVALLDLLKRTSPAEVRAERRDSSRSISFSPTRAALSTRPPSRSLSVASAAAADTGLPPNVEPWPPPAHCITSSRASSAPRGIPDAMPLASV